MNQIDESIEIYKIVLEKNPVVIIWSHGQTRPQKSEKCSSRFNKIPKTLKLTQNSSLMVLQTISLRIARAIKKAIHLLSLIHI